MMTAAATSAMTVLALSLFVTSRRHAAMNGTTIMNRISFMSRHLRFGDLQYIRERVDIIQIPTKFRLGTKHLPASLGVRDILFN